MPVELREAMNAHLGLSHALAEVWPELSEAERQVIDDELRRWDSEHYGHSSADEHLEYLKQRLEDEVDGDARSALLSAAIDPDLPKSIYRAVAEKVYPLYGKQISDQTLILFETSPRNKAPYPPPHPRKAGGCGASACFDRGSRGPEVLLSLCPKFLGPPTLATVPYLLCHELVCHAFQGVERASDDPFSEGWMDRVAVNLHDYWADELFPVAPQLAREEAHFLSQLVRTYFQGLEDPYPATRAARFQGWMAAGLVEQFFKPFEHGGGEPSLFTRLSTQMNVEVTSVDHRAAFVANVLRTRRNAKLRLLLNSRLREVADGIGDAKSVLNFFCN